MTPSQHYKLFILFFIHSLIISTWESARPESPLQPQLCSSHLLLEMLSNLKMRVWSLLVKQMLKCLWRKGQRWHKYRHSALKEKYRYQSLEYSSKGWSTDSTSLLKYKWKVQAQSICTQSKKVKSCSLEDVSTSYVCTNLDELCAILK